MRVRDGWLRDWPAGEGEAVFETPGIIDVPFLDIVIPLVGEALAIGVGFGGSGDGLWCSLEAVVREGESPLP
jgi:hypothetical protein